MAHDTTPMPQYITDNLRSENDAQIMARAALAKGGGE